MSTNGLQHPTLTSHTVAGPTGIVLALPSPPAAADPPGAPDAGRTAGAFGVPTRKLEAA